MGNCLCFYPAFINSKNVTIFKGKNVEISVSYCYFLEPSIWEKKYLNEKERALKLEEELNLLKSELGASQKKLLKIFENNGLFYCKIFKLFISLKLEDVNTLYPKRNL